jgi:hypothetical protein
MRVTLDSASISGLRLDVLCSDHMIDVVYLDEAAVRALFDALGQGKGMAIKTLRKLVNAQLIKTEEIAPAQAEDALARLFGEGLFNRMR